VPRRAWDRRLGAESRNHKPRAGIIDCFTALERALGRQDSNDAAREGEINERYRLIYKRECQGHFSLLDGRGERALDFQPCRLCGPLRLGFLPSGPAAGLARFHVSYIFSLVTTTRSVCEAGKPSGCLVGNT
jgi:hypothetical protein